MPAQPSEQIYVVQAGDTLSRIATRVYNNPALWERIYEANRETLRSPESIRVGQTLRIPQNGN
ncbi:MAG: LysM peptidoglycan-binding domain-containing protein [Verrucomicrobia bacterium]|nr:LysM peptidoglycan-binding domain-containing protein [Kiritimatiellia bacterium]MCP5489176.1 LysM peptidoglycan-binding domain-containing protein [Verrucomicrobiota bacterium]